MDKQPQNNELSVVKQALLKIRTLESELATQKDPIAIIGMGCRFPGGANNPEAFWNMLKDGKSAVTEVPASRWDNEVYYNPDPDTQGKITTKYGAFLDTKIDEFDAEFFGISPKEAEYMDPQQRLLLEVVWEALEQAKIAPRSLAGSQTGVFLGICTSDYHDLILESGNKEDISAYWATGTMHSTAAGRISYVFDFKGPSVAVDTACSSSLVALDQACNSLHLGSSNVAIAGGVNLMLCPDLSIDFSRAGMLAPDGKCKTFDAKANGYVRGEGCGIIILKRLKDALKDKNPILGVIRSSGINQDGASGGLTIPSGPAQETLIKQVLQQARLKPGDVDYVEAHGTGTPLGDPIEVGALGQVYGQRDKSHPLLLGSVKTNIGHTEGAAGIAGVIKVLLSLQHETIPPHLNFETLNPHINLDFPVTIVTKATPWKHGEHIRRASVSSFGFSGTNAHVIIEESPGAVLPQEQVVVPFNRKRYWAEAAIPTYGKKLSSLHPLLGEKYTNPKGEIFFLGQLDLTILPYLKDHQVYDYIIYPGVGYLEMLLAAATIVTGKKELQIVDVIFENALRLNIAKVCKTQISVTQVGQGFALAVYSQKDDETWQSHAQGTVLNSTINEKETIYPIDEIKSRCKTIIGKDELYEHSRKFGITLGKSFQTINTLYSGENEALVSINLVDTSRGYIGHPGLFDSAMQLVSLFPLSQDASDLYLPIGCDAISMYGPLEDVGFAYCHNVTFTDSGKSANVSLCNSSGKELLKITGVQFRKTTQNSLRQLLTQQESKANFSYEWTWQEHVLPEAVQVPGKWLILGQNTCVNQIVQALQIPLIDIPKSKEALMELLQKEPFAGVMYVTEDNESFSFEGIKTKTQNVLYLAQALIALHDTVNIPLILITTPQLVNSPLNGLFKTITVEHPELSIKQIILTADADPSLLRKALAANDNENILSLKKSQSFVPRFVHSAKIKSEEPKNKIHPNATYLITGGLGGIGITLAKWLVEKGATNIVLTGRRPLDDESKLTLQNLGTPNTKITYTSLDIGDEQSVATLLTGLQVGEKPLKGIFHLAGVLDDATLMEQTWDHFEKVYRPKVHGSYYLHQYSKNLDLFVMFSSIASSLGSPGQSNYAAANAFMDGLSQYRKLQSLPTHSLSWGPWAEVGMAKDLVTKHAKAGLIGLSPADGMISLEASLTSPQANTTIANINWKNYLKQIIEVPSWLQAFVKEKTNKNTLFAQLETVAPDDRLGIIKAYVSDTVKAVLGLSSSEGLDDNKGFFDIGLDSLMAVELKNHLQTSLGKAITLASTVVFDHPSVAKMTAFIANALKLESLPPRKQEFAAPPLQPNEPIAIIGMSCRFPGGANTIDDFWTLLENKGDAIVEVPSNRWDPEYFYDPDPETPGKIVTKLGGFLNVDISLFDAEFFGISPKEALYLDPQQRLMLEVCYEAIESAGIQPQSLNGSLTACFIGICSADYFHLITAHDKEQNNAYTGSGNMASAAAGRIAFFFGFEGPNYAIDTACSSSLVAIDEACERLQKGEANLALAGGVNLLISPDISIGFSKANMLAPDGRCKTFDASANGYVRGEGCGIIVLKRLSDAKRDGDTILAVIKGSAINQNGASGGLTVPNGDAQERLIQTALKKASLKGADIDYVEAHGTGTSLGDPIEIRAIGAAYGQRDASHPLNLASVKTNIGHLEGAAGVAGVIKTVLALQHETMPAQLHYKTLNPQIELNFPAAILTENKPWKQGNRIRRAGVSSFGFSGINAHVILEEAPTIDVQTSAIEERPVHILTLSAKTEQGLNDLIQSYKSFLEKTDASLADICFTANTGRNHERYRAAAVASNKAELKEKLDKNKFIKGQTTNIQPLEYSNDLNELANAFVTGAEIDWHKFDAGYARKKVMLPTSTFQRKRYWAQAAISTIGKKLASVHPLLGEQHTNPKGEIYYLGQLDLSMLPYLKDHHVYEYLIFPGAGYVEMMLAAAKHALVSDEIELTGIAFQEALQFTENKLVETQIILTPTQDGNCDIAIYTKTQKDQWNCHAKGTVSKKDLRLPPPASGNILELKSRCKNATIVNDFYTQLWGFGLCLGKSFQTIHTLQGNDNESFGEVELAESAQGYLAHPALLDGCFQTLLGASLEYKKNELQLPIGIDRFTLYAPLEQKVFVFCDHVQTADMDTKPNLKIYAPSGKVLATIEGFHLRNTTEKSLKKMLANKASIDDLLYEWTWQEHNFPEASEQIDRWLVFGQNYIPKATSLHVPLADTSNSKEYFIKLLQNEPFTGVIYATEDCREMRFEDIKTNTQNVLHLSQAMVALHDTVNIPLVLITTAGLINSPLNGLFKTIAMEHPELAIKQIILAADADPSLIRKALAAKDNENILSLKKSQSFVPRLVHSKINPEESANKIHPNATYLITGGLGGLGAALAKWLGEKGATNVVLTGRRQLDDKSKLTLQNLQTPHTKITYISLDIGDEQSVATLLNELQAGEKPLKGIFHLAGVLDDATLMEQTWDHFEKVYRPKVYGSYYLHQYSKDLDHFVMFSSIASTLGSPGQSNYAAANAFMDGLSEYRRLHGLPAHSLSWGPWAEVGMAKDLVGRHTKSGLLGISPNDALRALEASLSTPEAHHTIANINWKNYLKQMIEAPGFMQNFVQGKITKNILLKELEEAPSPEALMAVIKTFVRDTAGTVLGLSTMQELDEKKSFFDLGLDSLMAIELKNRLQLGLGKAAILSTTAVFDHATAEEMTQYISSLIADKSVEYVAPKPKATLMSTLTSPKWIERQALSTAPKVRVFCFHHAGGSASAYKGWQQEMPAGVELNLIQLPGRENRYNEPIFTDLQLVTDGIVQAMLPYLDLPYIIFAHSFGTMIASEVIKSLQQMQLPIPQHIIFSSCVPFYFHPEKSMKKGEINNMSDDVFIHFVSDKFNGIPEQFLNDKKLLEPILPIVRGDFLLGERNFEISELFKSDITTIHCTDDKAFTDDEVKEWARISSGKSHHFSVPGGHLSILENPLPFIKIVSDIAKGVL